MKKIIYLTLTVIIAFILSSYTFSISAGKYKISDTTKSVNINVTAKNVGPYELKSSSLLEECLKSTIDINKLKADFIKKANDKLTTVIEYLPSNKEIVLDKYGYKKEFIIKRIRNDTLIKFISIILIIILAIYWGKEVLKNKDDWKLALVQLFFITLFIIALQLSLYYIISYVFNNEFLTIKELINLLI